MIKFSLEGQLGSGAGVTPESIRARRWLNRMALGLDTGIWGPVIKAGWCEELAKWWYTGATHTHREMADRLELIRADGSTVTDAQALGFIYAHLSSYARESFQESIGISGRIMRRRSCSGEIMPIPEAVDLLYDLHMAGLSAGYAGRGSDRTLEKLLDEMAKERHWDADYRKHAEASIGTLTESRNKRRDRTIAVLASCAARLRLTHFVGQSPFQWPELLVLDEDDASAVRFEEEQHEWLVRAHRALVAEEWGGNWAVAFELERACRRTWRSSKSYRRLRSASRSEINIAQTCWDYATRRSVNV